MAELAIGTLGLLGIGLLLWGLEAWRIRTERRRFGQAVNRRLTSLWAGLIGGGFLGLLLTLLAVLTGGLAPPVVAGLLSVVSVITLLLGGHKLDGGWLFAFGLAGLFFTNQLTQEQLVVGTGLLGAVLLGQAALLRWLAPTIDLPKVIKTPRGGAMVTYTRRQWYLVPLVVPVPGDWFAALPWWPQDQSWSILILPLVLGLAFTTKRQLPQTAIAVMVKVSAEVGLLLTIISGTAWWSPAAQPYLGYALALAGFSLLLARTVAPLRGSEPIVVPDIGVRLVAVIPDTPAAKMRLQSGDVVLTCNGIPVHDDASLYAAIQSQPTYCRLKVRRLDGELKLAEAAIFTGAPHELGMLTLTEGQL